MDEYHKINTVFMRDPATKNKRLLMGQYSSDAFEYLANNQWVFTEKVDGTNIRIMIAEDGTVTYGGKTTNDAGLLPTPLMASLDAHFGTSIKHLNVFPEGTTACLYGEGFGAKIQSGGKYAPDQRFVLFDVKVGNWWLRRFDVLDVAAKLKLAVTPVIGSGTLHDMVEMAREGFYSAWNPFGQFIAEGIVARPFTELCDRGGNRIITKIKYKDFEHAK